MLLYITSGRGPAECELAAYRFLEILSKEFETEVLAKTEGRFAGCIKSAIVRISGNDASMQGTVLWICKSPYRPFHGRKNWFIGVNRMDEPADCNYETGNGGGVVFQTFRASGKGGQYVNKTESAVRAIHTAAGLSATASDERSQYLNKKKALTRLNEMLKAKKAGDISKENETLFFRNNNLRRGNPIRIYEGIGFKRIDAGGGDN